MENKKAIFNWSGGKDSSLCLYKILQSGEYEISYLLTSVSSKYQRITQHGVRVELLKQQATNIGIPLYKLIMPDMPTMTTYNIIMNDVLKKFQKQGIHLSIFGDIFLEDIRKYREEQLAMIDFRGVFPLWQLSTKHLAKEFIDLGYKAVVVCVNRKYLDKNFAGREFNEQFLKDLPENVDPCGEYGEFHSFVYDGPIFKKPIDIERGKIVYKKYKPTKRDEADTHSYTCGSTDITSGFWYCDLLPKTEIPLKQNNV